MSRKWWLGIAALAVASVVVSAGAIMYTNWLWFGHIGYGSVYVKVLQTRVLLFLVFGALFFAILYPNLRWARRTARNLPVPLEGRLIPVDDKLMLDRYVDKAIPSVAFVSSFVAGLLATNQWVLFLRMGFGVPFHYTDPVFHQEVGFYVFQLPFLQYAYKWLFVALAVALGAALLLYIYDDAIQIAGEQAQVAPEVTGHVSALLGFMFLLKVCGYRLGMWTLLFSTRGKAFGASYADLHARLPALWILVVAGLAVAALCFVNARRRSGKLMAWSLGGVAVLSLVAGSLFPLVVQRYLVEPNELDKEMPYLKRNIEATLRAYGLDKVRDYGYPAETMLTSSDLDANRSTTENIRLWDNLPARQTYGQLQEIRTYYQFLDVDVDRYWVDGVYRQVMISARELAHWSLPSRSWVNDHILYTHGYGVCVSPVNAATPEGQPELWVKNLPPESVAPSLNVRQPRLYYGEWAPPVGAVAPASPQGPPIPQQGPPPGQPAPPGFPGSAPPPPPPSVTSQPLHGQGAGPTEEVEYAIVNGSIPEFDYPKGSQNVTYQNRGKGGVRIDSVWKRLAFAWRFMDVQLALSGYITDKSRIVLKRGIYDRAKTIAPFLFYDGDPYPVIANGRIYWILDAYATTDMVPYSERLVGLFNYMRNSVKVVVDGFDGTITFYCVDDQDPLTACYGRIFPKLFRPWQGMPEALKRHLRYPQGLFVIQSKIFTKYHMTNPQAFYQEEDSWRVAQKMQTPLPGMEASPEDMSPYYIIMRPPGEPREMFLLAVPFTPASKQNLIAFMTADCDVPNYGRLTIYKFPKGKMIYGPMQIDARINQDPEISKSLTLWRQRGSQVVHGDLLVIPIGGALLYVQPLYLRSETRPMPELKKVIAVYNERIVMADTLAEALAQAVPRGGVRRIVAVATAPSAGKPAEPTAQLLREALEHFEAAEARRQAGNWAGYGEEQRRLGESLRRLSEQTAAKRPASPKPPAPSKR